MKDLFRIFRPTCTDVTSTDSDFRLWSSHQLYDVRRTVLQWILLNVCWCRQTRLEFGRQWRCYCSSCYCVLVNRYLPPSITEVCLQNIFFVYLSMEAAWEAVLSCHTPSHQHDDTPISRLIVYRRRQLVWDAACFYPPFSSLPLHFLPLPSPPLSLRSWPLKSS